MKITVNGSPREVPDNLSASDLLVSLGLIDKRLALEVNQEIVTRGNFTCHKLNPGDQVEIVHAIGGG